MTPFTLSAAACQLKAKYPDPDLIVQLFSTGSAYERSDFVRLWLSEGIPAAFADRPMLYEESRSWIAYRLGRVAIVHSKQVSLVGSARFGYSLKPRPTFTRAFGDESDLDFIVVSQALFDKAQETSLRFVNDFEARRVTPRPGRQARLWPEDVDYIKTNLSNGFVQQGKVPTLPPYEVAKELEQTFWLLSEKLKRSVGAPAFSKASYRIYRDWDSFIARAVLNLRAVADRSRA
jgi:hypothetical protein